MNREDVRFFGDGASTSPARRSRSGPRRSGSSSPIEGQNWTLSQFMHGEQGALLCTARIVETVPWIDAKYYAATQVMDEARHVEVFAKYLDEKLDRATTRSTRTSRCCSTTSSPTRRWDMTYLGMQIMVEGLALAAFGLHAPDDHRAAAEAARSATS